MENAVGDIELPASVDGGNLPRSYLFTYMLVPTSEASQGTDQAPPPATPEAARQQCEAAAAARLDLINNRQIVAGLVGAQGMAAYRRRLHGNVTRAVVVDGWLALAEHQRKEWGEALALDAVCTVADVHGVDLERPDGTVLETVSSWSRGPWTHVVYPPTEQEMDAAITGHGSAVFDCARGVQGRAVADITFDNSGSVSAVTIDADFLTDAQRTCVEQAIRQNVRTRPFTEGNSVSIRKGFGFGR